MHQVRGCHTHSAAIHCDGACATLGNAILIARCVYASQTRGCQSATCASPCTARWVHGTSACMHIISLCATHLTLKPVRCASVQEEVPAASAEEVELEDEDLDFFDKMTVGDARAPGAVGGGRRQFAEQTRIDMETFGGTGMSERLGQGRRRDRGRVSLPRTWVHWQDCWTACFDCRLLATHRQLT